MHLAVVLDGLVVGHNLVAHGSGVSRDDLFAGVVKRRGQVVRDGNWIQRRLIDRRMLCHDSKPLCAVRRTTRLSGLARSPPTYDGVSSLYQNSASYEGN
eukprot:1025930-Prymnesium_polylepis.1